jgi:uncharacterized protein YpbB
MKRNFIQTIAGLMLISNIAMSEAPVFDQKVAAEMHQELRLAKIKVLLAELAKEKAIEVDDRGHVVVKQSIREQLQERQRLNSMSAIGGGLCE